MFHVDNISIYDFGCYSGAYPLGAKTPNIDRFAGESLMLPNYNGEAQCAPSRQLIDKTWRPSEIKLVKEINQERRKTMKTEYPQQVPPAIKMVKWANQSTINKGE